MTASTPSAEFPKFSAEDYSTLLEGQRVLLVDLMTPDPCPGVLKSEPHAYHSDDTFGDLTSALYIYAQLLPFLYDYSGEELEAEFSNWMKEQWDESFRDMGLLEGEELNLHDLIPPYSCDGVSGAFYTLFERIAKVLDPTGEQTP